MLDACASTHTWHFHTPRFTVQSVKAAIKKGWGLADAVIILNKFRGTVHPGVFSVAGQKKRRGRGQRDTNGESVEMQRSRAENEGGGEKEEIRNIKGSDVTARLRGEEGKQRQPSYPFKALCIFAVSCHNQAARCWRGGSTGGREGGRGGRERVEKGGTHNQTHTDSHLSLDVFHLRAQNSTAV